MKIKKLVLTFTLTFQCDADHPPPNIGRVDVTMIYVPHTVRAENGEEIIRIISARKATAREERRYFDP